MRTCLESAEASAPLHMGLWICLEDYMNPKRIYGEYFFTYHIALVLGYGVWFQFYGSFGPSGGWLGSSSEPAVGALLATSGEGRLFIFLCVLWKRVSQHDWHGATRAIPGSQTPHGLDEPSLAWHSLASFWVPKHLRNRKTLPQETTDSRPFLPGPKRRLSVRSERLGALLKCYKLLSLKEVLR